MSRTEAVERRIDREMQTVRMMIGFYCRDRHRGGSELCADCRTLLDYAEQRVDRCPFRADKPTCLECTVHCYKPAIREQVRAVMRHAGPRMAWRHPILSLFHFLDGRRSRRSAPVRASRAGKA